ncbi:hypothetical protein PAAG_12314 [Paracoccidioides lutzii Pb01]|uniref:Uncharacterized protein n=1 Tax=Paracoccidioides lutzii (strain ATCC MYA-826 / Pb01) TaxID=502779 RepID=A0A0A2VJB5_PARBA|nr:hypothetical protein PAAG_12314 [Paracoccidioides lutzii Pb01]KGQ01004.1 hypothetical protein PAAG_12314 [Paracoccidioides lutzii Pb01]
MEMSSIFIIHSYRGATLRPRSAPGSGSMHHQHFLSARVVQLTPPPTTPPRRRQQLRIETAVGASQHPAFCSPFEPCDGEDNMFMPIEYVPLNILRTDRTGMQQVSATPLCFFWPIPSRIKFRGGVTNAFAELNCRRGQSVFKGTNGLVSKDPGPSFHPANQPPPISLVEPIRGTQKKNNLLFEPPRSLADKARSVSK